jgi:DNA-binding MarR family transcriptional regulator
MNKKRVDQLSDAVTTLRANGFEGLTAAALFCVAASATANGAPIGVTEISRLTKLPVSTVSRLLWEMSQRGLLEYTTHVNDRRMRLVRVKLDAFK